MSEPIKHQIIINTDPPMVLHEIPPYIRAVMTAFMACYSCNTIMERGTQCPNCGNWCR